MVGRLVAGACQVLTTADALAKAQAALDLAAGWDAGTLTFMAADLPLRPARPARPELRLPRDMPRRRMGGGTKGRIAMLHALAHIELNAIDLACDILARFACGLPPEFATDWLNVAAEEAKHFMLLSARLRAYDAGYGDLPAHDGLWQAADATADDVLARLAVVPMVLEARGLDVTPMMIERMTALGDEESAAVLKVIYQDEIGHVATGQRWFDRIARCRGLDPLPAWQDLVRRRFKGALKRPFNAAARDAAGLPGDYYEPLAEPAGDLVP
ncbi:MAG TPA: ferritin-like domain-containing protein [Stellaceae bacterium]|nr:ferritin-like domain-containing protein [Stellaceae bacterium]